MNAIRQHRGVITMRPAGTGHTVMDILTPLLFPDVYCAAYVVSPLLIDEVIRQHNMLRETAPVPSLIVHRMRGVVFSWNEPLGPVLHVVPSTLLSRADSGSYLENLLPDMIIANEGAGVTRRESVRAQRVMKYLREHPNVRYLIWTDDRRELEAA